MEGPRSAAPQSVAESASDEGALREKVRALCGKRDGDPDREWRAKSLLDRLARRHGEADVDLLDWFVHHADVEPALRNHAVGLLLGLGHPHALRVSPKVLAAYRARPRRPIISLGVMGLYLAAELYLVVGMMGGGITEVAQIIVNIAAVHLPIWTLSVLGAVFLPDSSPWKYSGRGFTWLLWLYPILVLIIASLALGTWSPEVGLLVGGTGALAFVPGIAAALRIATFHPERAAPRPSRRRLGVRSAPRRPTG